MMNIIKKISDWSLYLSIMLVVVMIIGYAFGITILCSSLVALLRMSLMTVGKLVMYLVINNVKLFKEINVMQITR